MQEVTIAGEVFKIEPRYKAGHPLTENEASALNQTYFENIRNNMAKAVADAKESDEFDIDEFQEKVTAYASEYEFGARRSRAPADPVAAEAFRLAKNAIIKALNDQRPGHDTKMEVINEKARELIDHPVKGQKYRQLAEQIVSARTEATSGVLDELNLSAA